MSDHAKVLPCSSSGRWMACPPSAVLNSNIKEKTNICSIEGSCAHELADYKVKVFLGNEMQDPRENLSFYDSEMEKHTDGYVQFIEEYGKDADLIKTEERLDLSDYIPEGFGTADCIIIKDNTLTVMDLKYGAGVLVEAENNPQLMCYGLGAISAFGHIYDIKKVVLIIYQPRRESCLEWEISAEDLKAWGENTLKPRAQLAYKGEGEFCPSENTCRFCKVKETCRARAEFYLEMAKMEFKPPVELSNKEIAEVLTKADGLAAWAADVKEYALNQALEGKRYTGFKLVEGRSVRKYTDEARVAEIVKQAGYDPYDKKIKGITAMTKLLGSKFNDILGNFITKPSGKPILVPEGDKRDEITNVKNEFKEI